MISGDDINICMTTQLVHSGDQVSTDLKGEAIILNVKTGKYFSLNEVGTRVWKLLAESVSVQTIYETIVNEYQVEAARCEQDIKTLLASLYHAGLVLQVEPVLQPGDFNLSE
jgi:hypothetical protein